MVRSSPRCDVLPVTPCETVAEAYGCSAAAWKAGPERVYARMAEVLVGRLALVSGSSALDLGAGTGAATLSLERRGAVVTALDIAPEMLALDVGARPSCVVGDARALPFTDESFDFVVAAFSLNHLCQPARGLTEVRRVTRPGGRAIVSAYASDDDHPVKAAVVAAVSERGWTPPASMERIRRHAMPKLATVSRAVAELNAAGLSGTAELVRIAVPDMTGADLVEWRLGMADTAAFLDDLGSDETDALRARCHELLGDTPPPLVRSIIVITIDP